MRKGLRPRLRNPRRRNLPRPHRRDGDSGPPYRAFVCHALNPWGYLAKDRSGRLDMIEPPDLGRLMAKIRGDVAPDLPTA